MSPEEQAELRRTRYNATISWLHKVHTDLMIMRVRPDFTVPPHKPGQYSTLGLGNWEPRFPGCQDEVLTAEDEKKITRRAYSIGCSVLDDKGRLADLEHPDFLEFYIVLVRESEKEKPPALTPRLFMLRQDDRLFLGEKITGHYGLDPVKPGDTVFVLSTGTGEAPHNYMLWDLLRRGYTGRLFAACCVRYHKDLGYLPMHEELMRRYPNYTYMGLTTREAETVKNKKYIQDMITSGFLEQHLGQPLDPGRTHVFLCGNPKMIGVPTKDRETGQRVYPQPPGVIEILERRGFQTDQPQAKIKGNIHFEEYW